MNRKIYLVRHGETAWTKSGQHTGLTDIPLTADGEQQAKNLRKFLEPLSFEKVLCSPLIRASRTCELAGFGERAEILPDLKEWNYGQYEGKTSQEISLIDPSWELFESGAPGGESLADVSKRAERILKIIEGSSGNILVFSSGHFLRALIALWNKLPIQKGAIFYLSPGSVSILGFEHKNPVIIELNNCNYYKQKSIEI